MRSERLMKRSRIQPLLTVVCCHPGDRPSSFPLLRLTDDHHRPFCVHSHRIRGAAEQEFTEPAFSMGAHPDDRYVLLIGNPRDLVGRVPSPYNCPCFDALCRKTVPDCPDPGIRYPGSLLNLSFCLPLGHDMEEDDLAYSLHRADQVYRSV